ncbi:MULTISPECIES: hypothetical protein [Nostocales]|uniref:Uncharacterized protein n=3 Tax=Nostocales TaxID=1161 RepID=A0A0C1R5J8_9CYAN|nr:hypothetical protein [Tolypothrix bouteillei]KAF3891173.1 hypothetical protein DA73_0400027815 [Tolypothrix bouteillei VB521301]
MALLASANLLLVLFDLSYVPWRNLYIQKLPEITHIYDPIKGIEPHRETVEYLKTVDALIEQVSQTGLSSSQVETTLAKLRNLSNEMVDSNPFAGAGKSGTLEKIKNRMRDRVNLESSKKAFATFWSQAYLSKRNWTQEIRFFNKAIRPLIATNYYRRIGEDSEFIDNFWLLDLPFIVIFAVELLARSYYIKRSHPGFSWFNAILWRWYDLFLLLPLLRSLRIIPVLIRLDQAKLLNLQPLRQQIHQGIIANFAEEITEIVVVRVINQIQGSIHRGELKRWLQQNESLRPYIDINNVNEIEAIGTIFVQTIIYQVLPKIQPETIAILRHTIDSAFRQAPIYRDLQKFPGIGQIQLQLSEQLATQIATNLYSAVVSATEDPVGAKLSGQLVQSFTKALGTELQNKHILSELQSLVLDFLEEVKLNYVQQMSEEEMMQILQQTRQLRTKPSAQQVSSQPAAMLSPKEKR